MQTLPAESPCRALPWAALPVGAKCLCLAAWLLLRVLAWSRRGRADA